MSELIHQQKAPVVAAGPELDESIWQAWKARNALHDRQGAAARMAAVKCGSLGVLFIAAILWGFIEPYQVAIRFAVSVGAVLVGFQALRSRRYGFAAVLAAITVMFNPVVAAFPMTGEWPFPVISLAVLAFTASLIWLRELPEGVQAALENAPLGKTDLPAWENEGGAPAHPEMELAGERKGTAR